MLLVVLCALAGGAVAQPLSPEPTRAARPLPEAAAIVGAVTVPLATGSVLLGYTDGLHNTRAWCVEAQGYSAPDCLALNSRWHVTAAGGRALVAVAVVSGLAAGAAAQLSPGEAALVGLSSTMVAGMAFSLGHNLEQGQAYYYAGDVAATDRLARRVGPKAVFWASTVVTTGVVALTVWALR